LIRGNGDSISFMYVYSSFSEKLQTDKDVEARDDADAETTGAS